MYRLLEVGEKIRLGDEFYFSDDEAWILAKTWGYAVQESHFPMRREIDLNELKEV